jgi:hypothetical protein
MMAKIADYYAVAFGFEGNNMKKKLFRQRYFYKEFRRITGIKKQAG